jgi:hypothetical protein
MGTDRKPAPPLVMPRSMDTDQWYFCPQAEECPRKMTIHPRIERVAGKVLEVTSNINLGNNSTS